MRYQIDHDLHIHSYISPCLEHDPRQTKEAILAYGLTNEYRLLCVTDHLWDKKVESPANTMGSALGLYIEKGRELLPLPQSKKCKFLFGMEVDIDYAGNIGVSKEEMEQLDFLVISPNHLHANTFTVDKNVIPDTAEEKKKYYQEKLALVLHANLPFEKCGLAHFVTCLVCPSDPIRVFTLFTDQEYEQIFKQVAEKGMGVELNLGGDLLADPTISEAEKQELLRPFRIAKAMGCKFYLASDAHSPEEFVGRKQLFEWIVDELNLEETDKFSFVTENRA